MILSQSNQNESPTFKTRVATFWNWFSQCADRFYQTIEAGNCPDLEPEVSQTVRHLFPGFAWVFGPGADGVGHSFTLSAEGDANRQFLTSFWLANAPEINGWTFYSTRQPSDIESEHAIQVDEFEIAAGDVLIDAQLDEENERIDIKAWHPSFVHWDQNKQYSILFIWLDEALGETGTQSWIGEIEISPDISENGIPVTALKEFVASIELEYGWKKFPPDETYSTYQLPNPSQDFPRADTIAGSTCNMNLVSDYFSSQGQMEDPLEETGAQFIYLTINPAIFPEGQQVEFRGQIEDALEDVLRSNFSGRVFGGALGMSAAYIDLVIFDGGESLRLIDQAMHQQQLSDQYSVEPFAVV